VSDETEDLSQEMIQMSEYRCKKTGTDGVLRFIMSLNVEMIAEDYFRLVAAQERGEEIHLERILTNSNLEVNTIHDDEEEIECVYCGEELGRSNIRGHLTHVANKKNS
jgi:hypothetical protein